VREGEGGTDGERERASKERESEGWREERGERSKQKE